MHDINKLKGCKVKKNTNVNVAEFLVDDMTILAAFQRYVVEDQTLKILIITHFISYIYMFFYPIAA